MERYVLRKPLVNDGEKITELCFDWDSISKGDLKRLARETRMAAGKKRIPVLSVNEDYQLRVAAKASNVPYFAFDDNMSGKDYTYICMLAQNFLLDGDSEEMEDEEHQTVSQSPECGKTPTLMETETQ